mmetsp:Transcript_2746/g.3708  ORF Transcript_2746/g.3708 Transcript_2746/m.3708 type:complete len:274 (-) Transcript_2746:135-956(-)|eukprot:CAMPEP_0198144932 /NCGR_PEP_ID=MMETSP1443-20131203/19745_1 /TAXON_ID=186043 /ORGANISM="Entomoneis sp., Strain CCMP2396" /LENGTH=273 /DNA_ID=CAMNT_0043808431 /DNA_START=30 /DNA_END=851 /DNA_ORIENTATION=+
MAQQGATVGLSLAGKGFFGSLCAGTFGLGVWQTNRYFEKTGLVAERQEALALEPLSDFTFEKNDFHRMRLKGNYLYEKECLMGPRSPPLGALPDKPGSSGQGMARAPMGYYVLTPFQVSGLDKNQVLIVNRGWIPRHLVHHDRRPREYVVPTWDRPDGTVSITCISSNPENPKIVVPEHKLNLDPIELFWMDLKTLREHIKSESSLTTPVVLSLVTAVQDEDDGPATSYPVSPPAQHVGEFKTTPIIHAGYATTWYGLATAGLYMTRMLILRK